MPVHTFEGDVAVRIAYDGNGDGLADGVWHFRRGSVERVEWDTDFDGSFDLRASYTEPGDDVANLQYQLTRVDEQYRLVPNPQIQAYPTHDAVYDAGPPPAYEARVDGEWRDSFRIELSLNPWSLDDPEAAPQRSVLVCERGAAVSLTTPARPEAEEPYRHTTYVDGRVARSVTGPAPDRLTQRIDYIHGQPGRSITLTDRDGDGQWDHEVTRRWPRTGLYPLGARMKIDGEWTGTFRDGDHRYVDGRLTEIFAFRTEDVVQRFDYDDDGHLQWVYIDSDYNGALDRRQQPDGTTQQREGGEWTGDFVIRGNGPSAKDSYTYRDGRLVRFEVQNYKEGWHRVVEYPEPGVVIVKLKQWVGFDGGWSRSWYYQSPGIDGLPNRLVRSAHDTNGDDEPDLFVDYEAFTISETRPADWPGE